MGCVYIAISPSNKKYVGVTSQNINERWKEHTQRARENRVGALYNAIRKYGIESFLKFTLFESDDWDLLCEKEKEFISENNSMYPNGYNLTIGGEGVPGRFISEESRKRMSEGQKKRFKKPEEREKNRIYGLRGAKKSGDLRRGKTFSTKEKIKKERIASGYIHSKEYKEAHSKRMIEIMSRPEIKAKVIEAAKKRAADAEWRKKVSASKKGQGAGRKLPKEQKIKMAEARRLWWAKKKGLVNN